MKQSKILLLILLFLLSKNVFSKENDYLDYENAEILFSTKKNITNKVTIIWKTSTEIEVDCNKENTKYGLQPFKNNLHACAIVLTDKGQTTCTIYTKEETNMHILGHEVRHCFQENWHLLDDFYIEGQKYLKNDMLKEIKK